MFLLRLCGFIYYFLLIDDSKLPVVWALHKVNICRMNPSSWLVAAMTECRHLHTTANPGRDESGTENDWKVEILQVLGTDPPFRSKDWMFSYEKVTTFMLKSFVPQASCITRFMFLSLGILVSVCSLQNWTPWLKLWKKKKSDGKPKMLQIHNVTACLFDIH